MGLKGKGKGSCSSRSRESSSRQQWAIKINGKIMSLALSTLEQIRSSPTMIWGWFKPNLMEAWSHIFPLTHKSKKKGFLHLTDSDWLAGMGKPLVAIPNGHSIKGGRKNPRVESTVSKVAGANFAKIKPSGGITVKENGRNIDLCNKFDGVFGSHHSSPNVWGKHSIQSPHNVQGSTDGDNGACNLFVEDRGVGQDQHEEFELEVAEPSKESTSSY